MSTNRDRIKSKLIATIRELFGIVDPATVMADQDWVAFDAVIVSWPVGVDKRLADRRLSDLGWELRPPGAEGPYATTVVIHHNLPSSPHN